MDTTPTNTPALTKLGLEIESSLKGCVYAAPLKWSGFPICLGIWVVCSLPAQGFELGI